MRFILLKLNYSWTLTFPSTTACYRLSLLSQSATTTPLEYLF